MHPGRKHNRLGGNYKWEGNTTLSTIDRSLWGQTFGQINCTYWSPGEQHCWHKMEKKERQIQGTGSCLLRAIRWKDLLMESSKKPSSVSFSFLDPPILADLKGGYKCAAFGKGGGKELQEKALWTSPAYEPIKYVPRHNFSQYCCYWLWTSKIFFRTPFVHSNTKYIRWNIYLIYNWAGVLSSVIFLWYENHNWFNYSTLPNTWKKLYLYMSVFRTTIVVVV